MKTIAGKVVLITGGAMGIGYAVASHFIRDKAKVALVDINEDALPKAIAELSNLGGEVYPYICDVTDREQVYELARRVHEKVGSVDVLVNNAGVLFGGRFMDVLDEGHARTIDVNTKGYMWMTKAFLPDILEKKRGNLVYVASAAGLAGIPMLTSYSASKHAVVGFAEALRFELMMDKKLKDIHITIVCPSYVATGMAEGVKPPRGTRWLKTEEMGKKIYEAVKKDKAMLLVPAIVRVEILTKILPPAYSYRLFRLLKVDTSMQGWTGRR